LCAIAGEPLQVWNDFKKMKKTIAFILILCPLLSFSQSTQKIFTQDIDNFWTAYDSINSTEDKAQQLNFIKRLYIDKASEGLKAFLKNKENPDNKWVDLIKNDRSFWDSVRPKTLIAKAQVKTLQNSINRLQALYPKLKEAASYFVIGFKQQGGTIRNNLSIIGTEVITSQANFSPTDLTRICIHEYVHTQQTKPDFRNINVLTSSIREGSCDFISELVLGQSLSMPYIKYGLKNEVQVWKVFKQDMLTSANDLWVSTGDNPTLPARDLGYFIGYAICKSYYNSSKNKSQAIKAIIDLDYTNQDTIITFLKKSNYQKYLLANGYDPSKQLGKEGYVSNPSQITFVFSPLNKTTIVDEDGSYQIYDPKKMGKITSISIAGDFNNWEYKHSAFQLTRNKSGKFTLTLNKNELGKIGQQVKFKFVINNKYRVAPNFAITNRVTDNEGNTNLYVQL